MQKVHPIISKSIFEEELKKKYEIANFISILFNAPTDCFNLKRLYL